MSLGQELTGKRIREARKKAGLSQQALAEKVGLAQGQSISNYERNQTAVDTDRLRRIARATSHPMSFSLKSPGWSRSLTLSAWQYAKRRPRCDGSLA